MKKCLLFSLFLLCSTLIGVADNQNEKKGKKMESLIGQLFKIGAIQEGEFHLKSGIDSPVYIDLRRVISYPEYFQQVVDLLAQELGDGEYHHIVGVPYAALPLASGIAVLYQKSMIMPRKEVKEHGTCRAIEGVYQRGQKVIIIEDIVTTGDSILETVTTLKNEGLEVEEVIVFLDRQQGAQKKLAEHGITLRAVCTLSDVLATLQQSGHIDETAVTKINNFIKEHQF